MVPVESLSYLEESASGEGPGEGLLHLGSGVLAATSPFREPELWGGLVALLFVVAAVLSLCASWPLHRNTETSTPLGALVVLRMSASMGAPCSPRSESYPLLFSR